MQQINMARSRANVLALTGCNNVCINVNVINLHPQCHPSNIDDSIEEQDIGKSWEDPRHQHGMEVLPISIGPYSSVANGLPKVGNSCFLACVLHALAHMPSFHQYLRDQCVQERPLAGNCLSFIDRMYSRAPVEESVFQSFIDEVNKGRYSCKENSKAGLAEFIQFLLEKLFSEKTLVQYFSIQFSTTRKQVVLSIGLGSSWRERLARSMKQPDGVNALCNSHDESLNQECYEFLDNGDDVVQCLAQMVCDGNLLQRLREHFKTVEGSSLCERLPSILIIQLVRHTDELTKREDFVHFPLTDLDLAAFVSPNSSELRKESKYDCFAVVNMGINAGHYTTLALGEDGKWRCFDDAKVSPVQEYDVVSSKAFCLFYMKKKARRYKLDVLLGEGGFSQVWRANDSETKCDVAVKINRYVPDDDNMNTWFQFLAEKEADILRNLRHPCIVTFCDAFVVPGTKRYAIVMEYCSNGDLKKLLSIQINLPEERAAKFVGQIYEGIRHLAERGIVHYDLKPQNILLDSNYNAKIADFGLSKVLDSAEETLKNNWSERNQATPYCGSFHYQPPEFFSDKEAEMNFSKSVDIWAFGATMYELLTGCLPYGNDVTDRKVFQANHAFYFQSELYFKVPISEDAKAIIRSCLTIDQKLRPCAADIPVCEYVNSMNGCARSGFSNESQSEMDTSRVELVRGGSSIDSFQRIAKLNESPLKMDLSFGGQSCSSNIGSRSSFGDLGLSSIKDDDIQGFSNGLKTDSSVVHNSHTQIFDVNADLSFTSGQSCSSNIGSRSSFGDLGLSSIKDDDIQGFSFGLKTDSSVVHNSHTQLFDGNADLSPTSEHSCSSNIGSRSSLGDLGLQANNWNIKHIGPKRHQYFFEKLGLVKEFIQSDSYKGKINQNDVFVIKGKPELSERPWCKNGTWNIGTFIRDQEQEFNSGKMDLKRAQAFKDIGYNLAQRKEARGK